MLGLPPRGCYPTLHARACAWGWDRPPNRLAATVLEDHWLGVCRWHHSRVSNGLLEGLNSLIQAAKRRARGYRTNRNYIAMIYLIAGKLNPGPTAA